ncbi:MAG: TetR/AcrR family transcriptional regulator [Pseudomonadota bacterium]
MTRPPKAKLAVLEAARRIVSSKGTGSLTFETLVAESGITRGGITYHFPTKEALLYALIEHDLAQWNALEAAQRPDCDCPQAADLIAHVRAHTGQGTDKRRFVAGMLSAATLDPTLLDPVRGHFREVYADTDWNDAELKRHILRLAAEGLFWSEIFECFELPAAARARLVKMLEELAQSWADQPLPQPNE